MPPIPMTSGQGSCRYPNNIPDSPRLGLFSPLASIGDCSPPYEIHNPNCDSGKELNYKGEDVKSYSAKDASEGNSDDWYWQCHLCAHLNALPRLYRDFASVPLALSQPCGNRDVPPREPTYGARPAGPEDRSLEARIRRRVVGDERNGAARKSAYQKLLEAEPPLVGRGERAASLKGAGGRAELVMATTTITGPVGRAGVNYAAVPIEYAFSVADNSRAGPSKPVRYRGTTGGRAWPGMGSAALPQIAEGNVRGYANSRASGDANAPGVLWSGSGWHVQAGPAPVMREALKTSVELDVVSSLGVVGEGSVCTHRRCEGCYDLDARKRVVRFCGGSEVNAERYARWYASFNFVDDIEPRVLDGGLKGWQKGWHPEAEMRRGDSSRPLEQARSGSPVLYTAGESRILLVHTAQESEDESQDDNAARASSDGGGGFFGYQGRIGGDDGKNKREDVFENESDGGNHSWIEEITYAHRRSQDEGGCSESDES